MRPFDVCDFLMPPLDITHPIDEGYHLLLDSHPKRFDLERLISIVNIHDISGFSWAKQQRILNVHKLVGLQETCRAICGHSQDLEAYL